MKKLLLIAVMMMAAVSMNAQDNKFAVGLNVGYASFDGDYSPVLFGAKFQYEFVTNFRAELAADYFTKKHDAGLWDANLNLQYLIGLGEGFKLYPLAGVSLVNTTGWDDNESAFGYNFGVGAEYFISDNIKINLDIKYQSAKKDHIKYADGPVFAAGIAYTF